MASISHGISPSREPISHGIYPRCDIPLFGCYLYTVTFQMLIAGSVPTMCGACVVWPETSVSNSLVSLKAAGSPLTFNRCGPWAPYRDADPARPRRRGPGRGVPGLPGSRALNCSSFYCRKRQPQSKLFARLEPPACDLTIRALVTQIIFFQ